MFMVEKIIWIQSPCPIMAVCKFYFKSKMNLTESIVADKSLKPLLDAIYQEIINEWPDAADTKRLQEYIYYSTNAQGFSSLVQKYLQQHLYRYTNLKPEYACLLQPINQSLDVRQRLTILYNSTQNYLAGTPSFPFQGVQGPGWTVHISLCQGMPE